LNFQTCKRIQLGSRITCGRNQGNDIKKGKRTYHSFWWSYQFWHNPNFFYCDQLCEGKSIHPNQESNCRN